MIGGNDLELWVPDQEKAVEEIFRTVRQFWPNYVFENAEAAEDAFLRPPAGGLPKPSGPEFFIYQNEQAAQSWAEHGATPENANTMLYIIVGSRCRPDSGLKSLTLVHGLGNKERADIIRELRRRIEDSNHRNGPEGGPDLSDQRMQEHVA